MIMTHRANYRTGTLASKGKVKLYLDNAVLPIWICRPGIMGEGEGTRTGAGVTGNLASYGRIILEETGSPPGNMFPVWMNLTVVANLQIGAALSGVIAQRRGVDLRQAHKRQPCRLVCILCNRF